MTLSSPSSSSFGPSSVPGPSGNGGPPESGRQPARRPAALPPPRRWAGTLAVLALGALGASAVLQLLLAHRMVSAHSPEYAVALAAAGTAVLGLLLALAMVAAGLRSPPPPARETQQEDPRARVAENAGTATLRLDRSGRLKWANPAFLELTGYAWLDIGSRPLADFLISERSDPAAVAELLTALEQGHAARAELAIRLHDGRDAWVDVDLQPMLDDSGRVDGFVMLQSEIGDYVSQRLRRTALLAALPTAVIVHDQQGRVQVANRAARALLGAKSGDAGDALMALRPLRDDLEPLHLDELPLQRCLSSGQGERGSLLGLADSAGQQRWLLANTAPLCDAGGQPDGAVVCYVDVTERRRLLDELHNAEHRDALTQLPNRTLALERLQRAIEHRRKHPSYGFALLFIDVDRLRHVNDRLGHAAGDELLRQVAARLYDSLRPGDAAARVGSQVLTAARAGGDEFVVVLEGVGDVAMACQVADRLLGELSVPYTLSSERVTTSVSIGIVAAEQLDAGSDAEVVLAASDTAMYEAKRSGRACWAVFDPAMKERMHRTQALESELRAALAQGQLQLVYQPMLRLQDREAVAIEALLRWRHPRRGELLPADFIATADECGLADAIGDQVLHKACAQFALWQERWGRRAPPLLVVNLARAQLRQPGLVPEVLAVLEAHAMTPAQLQLDIADAGLVEDAQARAALRALRAAGVRLALDDFGSGQSSLARLSALPVDTVKIDRGFVTQAGTVESHRVLISATLQVAASLGMATVAEGVETEAQATLMAELGCELGQGRLFGRPLSAEGVDRWIEREAIGTTS